MSHECCICGKINTSDFIHQTSPDYMHRLKDTFKNTVYFQNVIKNVYPKPRCLGSIEKHTSYIDGMSRIIWKYMINGSKDFMHSRICRDCVYEIMLLYKNMIYKDMSNLVNEILEHYANIERIKRTSSISYTQPKIEQRQETIQPYLKKNDASILFDSPLEANFALYLCFTGLHFVAQKEIEKYRADFVIFHNKNYVIEIDGHDYHSSKQQRQHDYERERVFQKLNYQVIRFTGSEIYNDPKKCINEIFSIIDADSKRN